MATKTLLALVATLAEGQSRYLYKADHNYSTNFSYLQNIHGQATYKNNKEDKLGLTKLH